MRTLSKLYVTVSLGMVLTHGVVPPASAQIDPGFDLLNVIDGSTSIDLGAVFPGAGLVFSDGVPFPGLGNFTTGAERTQGLPTFNVGDTGVVTMEWFAEHSKSVTPVDRSLFGLGPGLADFHTVINRGGQFPHLPNTDGMVTPSIGSMSISRTGVNGGTFELNLDINPLIVFTTVGGSVTDLNGPDVLLVLDGSGLLNPVGSLNGLWSSSPPPDPIANAAFPTGGFYASVDPNTLAPSPTDLTSGGIFAARQVASAQVPTPSGLMLMGVAGFVGGPFRRRRG